MTPTEEKALRDFLMDSDCLRPLDRWSDDFNLFDVLKITRAEIRHSNLLAWLLDPNESHGMGDSFLKGFVKALVAKTSTSEKDTIHILLQNYYSYQVFREHNHMDIILYSDKIGMVVVIENKIGSGENNNQLTVYPQKIEQEYGGCAYKYLVFLTPEGDEASVKGWISFSYEELMEILEQSIKDIDLKSGVRLIIEDYLDTVRRNIMKAKDEELSRLCEEIYNKHRTALRLIYENVQVDDSLESEIMHAVLISRAKEGILSLPRENKWEFQTPGLDGLLPQLDKPESSWNTTWVYYYWFDIRENYLRLHLELGLRNLTSELEEKINKLIKAAGNKGRSTRYRRIWLGKEKIDDRKEYETAFQRAIEKLIDKAMEYEATLLEKTKEESGIAPIES